METGQRPISRRTLLGSATAVAAACATSGTLLGGTAHAAGPHPEPAAAPSSLWREYRRNPFNHPQIPYIGRAGRHRGDHHPPRQDARTRTVDVLDFGAEPDGSADAAPAINRALAAVGKRGGGTVRIPPAPTASTTSSASATATSSSRAQAAPAPSCSPPRTSPSSSARTAVATAATSPPGPGRAGSSGSARAGVGTASSTPSRPRTGPSRAGPATSATSGAPSPPSAPPSAATGP